MAWTHTAREYQVGNTVYRYYHGLSDASELTDYVIFDASTYVTQANKVTTKTVISALQVTSSALNWTIQLEATTDLLVAKGAACENRDALPPWPREVLIAGEWVTTDNAGVTGDISLTTLNSDAAEEIAIIMTVELGEP